VKFITALTIGGHGECYWLGAKHCGSDEFSGVLLSLMIKI